MNSTNAPLSSFRQFLIKNAADSQVITYFSQFDGNRPAENALQSLLDNSHADPKKTKLLQLLLSCITRSAEYPANLHLQGYADRIQHILADTSAVALIQNQFSKTRLEDDNTEEKSISIRVSTTLPTPSTELQHQVSLFFSLPKEIVIEILKYFSCNERLPFFIACKQAFSFRQEFLIMPNEKLLDRYVQSCITYAASNSLIPFKDTFLDINNSQSFVTQCINFLKTQVTALNLFNCTAVSDQTLAIIVQLFPNITSLNLLECAQITDGGLQQLSTLFQLQSLAISGCNQITDSGLQQLNTLSQLHSLNLLNCHQITDRSVQHLNTLSQLHSLDLSLCTQITGSSLQYLNMLSQLHSLHLTGCSQITGGGVQYLNLLSQLHSLDLSLCTQITDGSLQHLNTLSQLRSLNLSCCNQITDSGLQHLSRLSQLQFLDLSFCNLITDRSVQQLSTLPQLRSLNLSCCNQITDSELQHLSRLSQLQFLDLSFCKQITECGVELFGALSKSRFLKVTKR